MENNLKNQIVYFLNKNQIEYILNKDNIVIKKEFDFKDYNTFFKKFPELLTILKREIKKDARWNSKSRFIFSQYSVEVEFYEHCRISLCYQVEKGYGDNVTILFGFHTNLIYNKKIANSNFKYIFESYSSRFRNSFSYRNYFTSEIVFSSDIEETQSGSHKHGDIDLYYTDKLPPVFAIFDTKISCYFVCFKDKNGEIERKRITQKVFDLLPLRFINFDLNNLSKKVIKILKEEKSEESESSLTYWI